MVKADKELKEAAIKWEGDTQAQKTLAEKRIQWLFNPPEGAPRWRRLGETDQVREKDTGCHRGSADTGRCQTSHIFCEVERIVNNRPLPTTPETWKSSPQPTPCMLMVTQIYQQEQLDSTTASGVDGDMPTSWPINSGNGGPRSTCRH